MGGGGGAPDLLGLKIFDVGIFFFPSIFWVTLFKWGFFLSIETNVSIFRVVSFNAFWIEIFMARKFGIFPL